MFFLLSTSLSPLLCVCVFFYIYRENHGKVLIPPFPPQYFIFFFFTFFSFFFNFFSFLGPLTPYPPLTPTIDPCFTYSLQIPCSFPKKKKTQKWRSQPYHPSVSVARHPAARQSLYLLSSPSPSSCAFAPSRRVPPPPFLIRPPPPHHPRTFRRPGAQC